jgi:hypothetical protein
MNDDDLNEKSPALAFMRDMLSADRICESMERSKRIDNSYMVPGEIAAAIETQRPELLAPINNRLKQGVTLPQDGCLGLVNVLQDYYEDLPSPSVRNPLMESLREIRRQLREHPPTVELCQSILGHVTRLIADISHRRKKAGEGKIPMGWIPDGPTRSVPFI